MEEHGEAVRRRPCSDRGTHRVVPWRTWLQRMHDVYEPHEAAKRCLLQRHKFFGSGHLGQEHDTVVRTVLDGEAQVSGA